MQAVAAANNNMCVAARAFVPRIVAGAARIGWGAWMTLAFWATRLSLLRCASCADGAVCNCATMHGRIMNSMVQHHEDRHAYSALPADTSPPGHVFTAALVNERATNLPAIGRLFVRDIDTSGLNGIVMTTACCKAFATALRPMFLDDQGLFAALSTAEFYVGWTENFAERQTDGHLAGPCNRVWTVLSCHPSVGADIQDQPEYIMR